MAKTGFLMTWFKWSWWSQKLVLDLNRTSKMVLRLKKLKASFPSTFRPIVSDQNDAYVQKPYKGEKVLTCYSSIIQTDLKVRRQQAWITMYHCCGFWIRSKRLYLSFKFWLLKGISLIPDNSKWGHKTWGSVTSTLLQIIPSKVSEGI